MVGNLAGTHNGLFNNFANQARRDPNRSGQGSPFASRTKEQKGFQNLYQSIQNQLQGIASGQAQTKSGHGTPT